MTKIIRPAPAEIEFKSMRFLITEEPQDSTIQHYIAILKEHRVTHLVCATDPTYKTDDLSEAGVGVTQLPFPDGSAPSQDILDKWLSLVKMEFGRDPEACVGVHCVTGLGRAPVLVAVTLIELGMKYEDAVELIRRKRRGAINSRQLEFLARYKRQKYFFKGKNKCRIHVMLVDGSVLEGGGQILRNAIALSSLLDVPVEVRNIRAGRSKPGLRAQHLAGIKLVAELTNAELEGCQMGSTWLKFVPKKRSEGGVVRADVGTAGGTTLLAQISLPCVLFAAGQVTMELTGGTNADFAPQIEYFEHVTRPNFRKFGISAKCDTLRRGYFPEGGGIVKLFVDPLHEKLKAIDLTDPGRLLKVSIRSCAAGVVPVRVAVEMADAARRCLERRLPPGTLVETDAKRVDAVGSGSSIVLVAETSTGCFVGSDAIGSKKNVTPIESGEVAAGKLLQILERNICVDDYMQDQMIIYMALASGRSRLLAGPLTLHTKTAIRVVSEMTGVKFDVAEAGSNSVIECRGMGFDAQKQT